MSKRLAEVQFAFVTLVTVLFLWATLPASAQAADQVCIEMPAPAPYDPADPQFYA